VGEGPGTGVTALAAWTAAKASAAGTSDYVRLVTSLDLLGGGDDQARAAALVDKFAEARELSHSLVVLDDVDQLCAGSGGTNGYSSIMLATLRALLRTPPPAAGKTMQIVATTSRSDAACNTLHEMFDETIVVPFLTQPEQVKELLRHAFSHDDLKTEDATAMAQLIVERLNSRVGCKTALRLAQRAMASSLFFFDNASSNVVDALLELLDDYQGDEATVEQMCRVL